MKSPINLLARFAFWLLTFSMAVMGPLLCSSPSYAHQTGQSYIFLRVYENAVKGRYEITLNDLNRSMGLITPDNQITDANIEARVAEIHAHYRDRVQFYSGGKRLPLRFAGLGKRELKIGRYALLEFSVIEEGIRPDHLTIAYRLLFDKDPNHRGLLVIEHFWKANLFNNEKHVSLVFSPSDHRQRLSLTDHSMLSGFLGVVKLGVKHIWKGIDHILFLIALILPAAMLRRDNKWEPITQLRPATMNVIKIVTLFTIAHSVTLSIAALGILDLPPRLVESVIALSIAMAALDILFPVFRDRIGWVVFIFGLFHGFGFASVLKELGVLGEHMALSLFGFNLGVEVGQLVIVGIVFPMIYVVRRYAFYPNIIMRYSAASMTLLSAVWFVERAFPATQLPKVIKDSFMSMLK